MGRPLNPRYLGTTNGVASKFQIQALVHGPADGGSTAGHLTAQNSPHRFRATTVNGTSLTVLSNGPTPTLGQSVVKVFPVAAYPTTYATANATLGATGNAVVINGGLGYNVGDFITLVGGTYAAAANVKVLANAAGGVITSLSVPQNALGTQKYTALPAALNFIPTANATGNGSGAVVSANFGLDTSYILTGGAGYTAASATVTYETDIPGTTEATVTNPVITANAVATGVLTVTNVGVLNAIPNINVENTSGTVVEYVKTISAHYVNTYTGNQYKWLHRGANVSPSYSGEGVKLAFLDTL